MPDPSDRFAVPPLDLGETLTPHAPPASAPTRASAKEFAPLLALLPIVAQRGGRAGVAALLQGFQQQRAQAQAQQRQGQLDTERRMTEADEARLRRATLAQTTANNEAQRRQQVLTSFQGGLEGLDSEEAVRAYLQLYGQQAQSVGLRPEVLEGFAMEAVTPSRLQKKEAVRVIESAKKQYGDQAVSHTYTLKDGTQANWEELNRRAGVGLGPTVTTSANTPEEQYVAEAIAAAEEKAGHPLSRGDKATIRLRAKREWTAASDRTPSGAETPDQVWVLRKGTPTPIRKGTARAGDVPYDAVAARSSSSTQEGPSAYSRERAARTVQSVDELLGKVSRWTTGFGSWLAAIPESDAANFAAELDTLKANIAFNELTQMREASKTGGALGQVSNVELGLLTSALGALNVKQSPANLRKQLEKIKASILRFTDAQAAQSTRPRVTRPATGNPFRRGHAGSGR